MLHLLIRKGVPAICKQVARHDGAAVADAALVQLRELQGWRGQWLEGALYLCTRQEGLHRASSPLKSLTWALSLAYISPFMRYALHGQTQMQKAISMVSTPGTECSVMLLSR